MSTDTDPRLPRSQAGPTPQHMLVTLFGDYWPTAPVALPSGGLVALLGALGFSAASARSALSRLASRGVLVPSRRGRHTFYAMNEQIREVGNRTIPRMLRFGTPTDDRNNWDGEWVVVAFSVPDGLRDLRTTLRSKLRWFGFTPLQDGVWIAPRTYDEELAAVLRDVGGEHVAAFRSSLAFPDDVRRRRSLSGLDKLRTAYLEFIDRYDPVAERMQYGTITHEEAFILRSEVMDTWRGFYRADPKFPDALLPEDWPLVDAASLFTSIYEGLGPSAERHCRELLAPYGLTTAEQPRHHTSEVILTGLA